MAGLNVYPNVNGINLRDFPLRPPFVKGGLRGIFKELQYPLAPGFSCYEERCLFGLLGYEGNILILMGYLIAVITDRYYNFANCCIFVKNQM